MQLVKLLRKESNDALVFIFGLTLVSGAANAALVALINGGARAAFSNSAATREFLWFMALLVVFAATKVRAEIGGKALFDNAMTGQRARLMQKLFDVPVEHLERMRSTDIIATSARNIGSIVQSSDIIVYGLQSMFMLFFCSLYLIYLSPIAFLTVVAGLVPVGLYRHFNQGETKTRNDRINSIEGDLSNLISEVLLGFKEVKLNQKRRESIAKTYEAMVLLNSQLDQSETQKTAKSRAVIQSVFYVVIAAVVFLIPRFTTVYSFEILEITAVVLFLIGYLTSFLNIIPMVVRTNAALESLEKLEADLDASAEHARSLESDRLAPLFEVLEARGLTHIYKEPDGSDGFRLGPLDFSICAGDLVYIIGGNGSGKSTFIKTLCGLYPTASPHIWLNGEQMNPVAIGHLREMFSLVMSDFHLFKRLYGYEDSDTDMVNDLIRKMRLVGKVTFDDGHFSTTELSTGERKRLALICVLIEDRPLLIFDEWAAEQDPHFREYFYNVLLPDLAAQGKAVISVTHDQSYLGENGRVLTMEYGRLSEAEK